MLEWYITHYWGGQLAYLSSLLILRCQDWQQSSWLLVSILTFYLGGKYSFLIFIPRQLDYFRIWRNGNMSMRMSLQMHALIVFSMGQANAFYHKLIILSFLVCYNHIHLTASLEQIYVLHNELCPLVGTMVCVGNCLDKIWLSIEH